MKKLPNSKEKGQKDIIIVVFWVVAIQY